MLFICRKIASLRAKEIGDGGFLKNRVYENFTPPPQKKSFKQKSYPPLQWQFENCSPPPRPPHSWPGGWIVEKFLGSTLGYMRKSLALWIWTGKRNNQKLGEIKYRRKVIKVIN